MPGGRGSGLRRDLQGRGPCIREWGLGSHRGRRPSVTVTGRKEWSLWGLAGRQNLRRQRLPKVKVKQPTAKPGSSRVSGQGDRGSHLAVRLEAEAHGVKPRPPPLPLPPPNTWQRPWKGQRSALRPLSDMGRARGPWATQAHDPPGGPGARTCAKSSGSALGPWHLRWEADQRPSQGDPESAGAGA